MKKHKKARKYNAITKVINLIFRIIFSPLFILLMLVSYFKSVITLVVCYYAYGFEMVTYAKGTKTTMNDLIRIADKRNKKDLLLSEENVRVVKQNCEVLANTNKLLCADVDQLLSSVREIQKQFPHNDTIVDIISPLLKKYE